MDRKLCSDRGNAVGNAGAVVAGILERSLGRLSPTVNDIRDPPGLEVDTATQFSLSTGEGHGKWLLLAGDGHTHAVGRAMHDLGHVLEGEQGSIVRQKEPMCGRDVLTHQLCSTVLSSWAMLNTSWYEKNAERWSLRRTCRRFFLCGHELGFGHAMTQLPFCPYKVAIETLVIVKANHHAQ